MTVRNLEYLMVVDLPEIQELDVNPLLVDENGVVALGLPVHRGSQP